MYFTSTYKVEAFVCLKKKEHLVVHVLLSCKFFCKSDAQDYFTPVVIEDSEWQ